MDNPRPRTLVVAGAVVAALVVGSIAAKVSLTPAHPTKTAARAHGGSASPAPGAIVIDPSIGDTFTPTPAGAVAPAPALTAAQAWADFAQVNGGIATIPSGLSVQLGRVSVPVGPANPNDPDQASLTVSNSVAYLALNELAYGYSAPNGSCPMSRNPLNPGPVGKSCTDWTFVDANTGQLIEHTTQVLS